MALAITLGLLVGTAGTLAFHVWISRGIEADLMDQIRKLEEHNAELRGRLRNPCRSNDN